MTKTEKKQTIIKESERYLANAKEILKTKAKPAYVLYEDKKYVKMAGHIAYTGVLHALDQSGIMPANKKGRRFDVKDYQQALAKENKKMLDYFNVVYQMFHISAGYDGIADKRTFPVYVETARELIHWAANKAA